MKIGVLGTGMVGQVIASALHRRDHDVKMGAREAANEKSVGWARAAGKGASSGTFADAAAHGEMVFNCTAGGVSLSALRLAGASNLDGKVLVDLANPLDFSQGFPALSVCNTDSLAEQIQREFPNTRVVKSLNTINCNLMVDASRVPGEHDVFVAGNDPEAKARVASLLREDFGWKNVLDLGDLTGARPLEMQVLMWLRLYNALGTPDFNVHVVKR